MNMSKTWPALAVTLALSMSLGSGLPATQAAGSTDTAQTITASAKSEAYAKAVYNKASVLLKKKGGLAYAKSYINKHIHSVNRYQAGLLVLKLENAAHANLGSATDKLLAPKFQATLAKAFSQGDSIDKVLSRVKDPALRKLLIDLRDSGYKLRMMEGMVYPIVDYDTYTRYQRYVSPDIKDYISLMAAESGAPSVGDAALLISWSEAIDRAVAQEAFIKAYPKSNRIAHIKMMYKASLTYIYYGMPNTPLFSYDRKVLDPDARKAYSKALSKYDVSKSGFLKGLESWSDVLKSSGDKWTQQVEKRRKELAPEKFW